MWFPFENVNLQRLLARACQHIHRRPTGVDAHLAAAVVTPALDVTTDQGAGVKVASSDGGGAVTPTIATGVGSTSPCAIPQAIVAIVAPALDITANQGTGVGIVSPRSAATAVAPMTFTTSTGVWRSRVVPSPNWPFSLFPQHLTPPLARAHACPKPTAMAVTPLKPATSVGVRGARRRTIAE